MAAVRRNIGAIALIVLVMASLIAIAGVLIFQIVGGPSLGDHVSQRREIAAVQKAKSFTAGLVTSSPDALAPIDNDEARKRNAAIPISAEAVVAASPFAGKFRGSLDFLRAEDCLAAAVYYEAASETLTGQRAVAQVVLNRVRHPAFPPSVCGVVFQGSQLKTGCQFSFTCDGSMNRQPSRRGWALAMAIAREALNGYVERSVGLATHYHTDWVFPYWSPKLIKLNQIGAHIFLRLGGSMGKPGAFSQAYAGAEQELHLAKIEGSEAAQIALPMGAATEAAAMTSRPLLPRFGSEMHHDEASQRTAVGIEQRWVLGGSAPPPPPAPVPPPASR